MIGIDKKIDAMKDTFTSDLFSGYIYLSYGRAYLNERDGNIVAEVLDSGDEYKDVLLDDSVDALSFFVVENDYEIENSLISGEVSIYFAVNLSVIYPAITERATEYLHRDVLTVLERSEFDPFGITSGIDAFKEFNVNQSDNMQPFYLCKFKAKISWFANC